MEKLEEKLNRSFAETLEIVLWQHTYLFIRKVSNYATLALLAGALFTFLSIYFFPAQYWHFALLTVGMALITIFVSLAHGFALYKHDNAVKSAQTRYQQEKEVEKSAVQGTD